MEVTYHKEGEYYLPDLIVPEAPKVGRYGMLRRRFLRENRNGTYTAMLLTGRLNQHLEEIDRQANEMMETLTAQMAKQEGVMRAASHASFATVRRLIRRDTFKYLSNLTCFRLPYPSKLCPA